MLARRSLLALALALSVVRCADQPTAMRGSSSAPRAIRWAGGSAPQLTATRSLPTGVGILASPPISLDQYAVSFWAVRGEARSVRINYRDVDGGTEHPFLLFTATDPESVPGMEELAQGDSILITLTVDTVNVGVSLEPTGLRFGTPSQLQIWYGGAGGDLNGDGVADSTDTYVESRLLGLWYRETISDPWSQVPAVQSLEDKSFTYTLAHFCDYELSYLMDWVVSW